MTRAILTAALVACGLSAAAPAHAEEDWFVFGIDCEPYESAPLIVVTRPGSGGPLTIEAGNEDFPAGTYYPYHLVVLAPDGGVAQFALGFFKNENVSRGAYDLTTCTDSFQIYFPPPILPIEVTGFSSLHVSER